jgi:hypothetical protein
MTPTITITKIDHDSWWGYYVGDKLYGYNDYYSFSDAEVKKEAVLQAIDSGLIASRKDPINVVLEHHTDWPELVQHPDLAELMIEEFSSELPPTLTQLKAWVRGHIRDWTAAEASPELGCQHVRTMRVNAKADDRQYHVVSHLEVERDGYAPYLDGICHGDYVELTLCLDCGNVISREFPVSDEELREAFGLDK